MNLRCWLGLHKFVKTGEDTREFEKEKPECIETYRDEISIRKCVLCGKEIEKLKTEINYAGVRRKKRKLINREWKNNE